MHAATLNGLFDELEKMKTAGILSNVGTKILNTAKSLPRNLKNGVQGSIQNAGKAVGSFATPIQSLKDGANFTVKDFKSMGKVQKGLMGFGLAASAHEALSKNDPLNKGRGRAERVGAAIGDQVGGLMGAPFGITGGIVAGQIGRKAGGMVGKGVGLLRSRPKDPAPPTT